MSEPVNKAVFLSYPPSPRLRRAGASLLKFTRRQT